VGEQLIRVRGASEHNLRAVDVDLPREALVVFTGVSGSGKSSLAFDTIFKEGQRRFLQSLSAYARQFLGQLEKPRVESIEGLSPAVCIDQRGRSRNPRSTVGTITELYDHLRLLFARLGEPRCPSCDLTIEALSPAEIVERLVLRAQGERVQVLAPVVLDRKGEYRKELSEWQAAGFVRARIDGELCRLEAAPDLDRYVRHTVELVVDRIVVRPGSRRRLVEAVERAVELAEGRVSFLRTPGARGDTTSEAGAGDPAASVHELQATARACPGCGFSLPELEPRLFSFNSSHGACPACDGVGRRFEPSLRRVMPDPARALSAGGLACLTAEGKVPFAPLAARDFEALYGAAGVSTDVPLQDLPAELRQVLLFGSGRKPVAQLRRSSRGERLVQRPFLGVLPALALAARGPAGPWLERWMDATECTDCGGTRLKPAARAVRFKGAGLGELARGTVDELATWLAGVGLVGVAEEAIGAPVLREIASRLSFLRELGLGYLDLDRGSGTLSGGEFQRIRLARQLGSRLQGVLYVLDEPSIGLHPRDNRRLIKTLRSLRDAGNTVLVVEHDEDTLRAADELVELGPDAGERGGHLVAQGTPERVAAADTHGGRFLSGRELLPLPDRRRGPTEAHLLVRGAEGHNLKQIDVRIPLGRLVAVTGVSGSGKSTLVDLTLRRALAQRFHRATHAPAPHAGLKGWEALDKVVEIDQSPIGRTPRSNPATYTKVFDLIRELYAGLPLSRARGYTKSRFSFNLPGGRCEECHGAGVRQVEMQFLAPVAVPCAVCEGRRFNPETLQVRYRGHTITDVLAMTIERALEFFGAIPKVQRTLGVLNEVGLGYLRLGQPSTTLSGGEAQRVKLASELRRPATGRTLYVLDEPTTGLHAHDVTLLVDALQRLVEAGNTVLVVEHNMEVVKVADHVIDLGPEGGEAGGQLVVSGSPEEVAACPASYTGKALAPVLERSRAALRADNDVPPTWLEASAVAEPTQPYGALPGPAVRAKMRDVEVMGARQHNLCDISVTIPGESLTVVTGPSGSGKSSLAFHTLFAEGQRRYVESLSTYARRFLGRMANAAVDRIEGLAPAVAIDQKSAPRSPRSTVATVTELHDHLRLLYARVADLFCPKCGRALEALSPSRAARRVAAAFGGEQVLVCAPWRAHRRLGEAWAALRADGLLRVRTRAGAVLRTDGELSARLRRTVGFEVVVDRLRAGEETVSRMSEAVEAAYRWGEGEARVRRAEAGSEAAEPLVLSRAARCSEHGVAAPDELSPRDFSFNHYRGACPECSGLGRLTRRRRRPRRRGRYARRDPDRELAPRPSDKPCPTCGGERLGPLARAAKVGPWRLPQMTSATVSALRAMIGEVELGDEAALISAELRQEVQSRLAHLEDLGLGYLELDRPADTLSGGEAQRIRLASQLGSRLSGCLYVLDEPTIGLHPADTERLLATLKGLKEQGNTVVVVEHDLQVVRAADQVLDLGPGAGEHGGRVMACGPPAAVAATGGSPTADFLSGTRAIPVPAERAGGTPGVTVLGARAHNLQAVSAELRLGTITCVTGVSGSGKSSLVMEVLRNEVAARLGGAAGPAGLLDGLEGAERIRRLVVVDQSPIGRNPRSNPASYSGLLDGIRKLFAQLPESQLRGYRPGRFSYNRGGGRCPDCDGLGAQQVEMHFLSDVWLTCDTCRGRRFNEATLQVRYRGLNIAEVLDLRLAEARDFFRNHRRLSRICTTLDEVGLGYLRLGQSATTLSGGEAQRLKLAAELGKRGGAGTLYLLDEPTTGLHLADVERLVTLLRRLADRDAAVVVIEHNLDVIKVADRVYDLGPGAGDDGGRLVAEGTPEQVAATPSSLTGVHLGPLLKPRRRRAS